MTKQSEHSQSPNLTFEAAFQRLEEILEKMNKGSISLEEALKLYEEADLLISVCGKRLNEAEKKVEILLKNRQGETLLNDEGKPVTESYF